MIKVTFGEHDRCDDKMRPETRFVLRAISQQFSFSNFDNDIALLRLNDRVPITDFIRPICLPNKKGEFHFQTKHSVCSITLGAIHFKALCSIFFCNHRIQQCILYFSRKIYWNKSHRNWLGYIEGRWQTIMYFARG